MRGRSYRVGKGHGETWKGEGHVIFIAVVVSQVYICVKTHPSVCTYYKTAVYCCQLYIEKSFFNPLETILYPPAHAKPPVDKKEVEKAVSCHCNVRELVCTNAEQNL